MRFLGDRRAQSIQIGAILLFGFLIVALSLYQAQVVPEDNRQVEFDHSQDVVNDVTELRNAVLRAGSIGTTQPQSVRLGTRYPQRTFFVNPPPVTGSLVTTDERQLRIENAEVDDGTHENVQAYWANHDLTFDTRSVQYRANYNELATTEHPTTVFESSYVANDFGDAVVLESGQTLVRDDRVALTAVSGEISESGVEPRSVDPEAVSRAQRSVPITGDGDDVEIVLPTAVENETRLAERLDDRIDGGTVAAGDGTVTVTLDGSDTYRLRLAEVSVDGDGETEPAYIVPVGPETVASGTEVGVEVRDTYNNPVEGATVEFDGETRTTGEDGRAFFEASEDVTASIGGDDWEEVEFDVVDGGGEGGVDDSGAGQGGNSEWSEDRTTQTITSQGGVWSGVGSVNSIVLSDPRITPIDPEDGEAEPDERYFRTALTVGDPPDGDRRFTFVVPERSGGMIFEREGGEFVLDDPGSVVVYDETDGEEVTERSAELRPAAVENWRAGDDLDLLDPNNYEDPDQEFTETLSEVREYLEENDDQEAFILDAAGRTDLTLEQREETMASRTEFVLGSGEGENNPGIVRFELENVGDEDVEIDGVTVDDTSADATVVDNGDEDPEFAGAGGSVNVVDGGIEIGDETVTELDENATIEPDDAEEFTLREFDANMNNEDVTVTVTFTDGSEYQFFVDT